MKITFVEAIRLGFVNFRRFKGTATRPEYWYFILFSVLLGIVLSTVESIIWPVDETLQGLDALNQPTPLTTAAGLILLLPTLALNARRFQDAGWSGKWLFLLLIPLIALGLATFGLIDYLQNTPVPTVETAAAVIAYFVPTLLLAGLVQIFFLILTLLPSKTKEQGNRFASEG